MRSPKSSSRTFSSRPHSLNSSSKKGGGSFVSADVTKWLTLTFATFLLVALVTFSASDPNWFYAPAQLSKKIQNACGYPGAFLAMLFIQLFGAFSFAIPLLLFTSLAKNWNPSLKQEPQKWLRKMGYSTFALSFLSLFSIHWSHWKFRGGQFAATGIVGETIRTLWLEAFRPVGATLILLGILGTLSVLLWRVPLGHFFSRLLAVGAKEASDHSLLIAKHTKSLGSQGYLKLKERLPQWGVSLSSKLKTALLKLNPKTQQQTETIVIENNISDNNIPMSFEAIHHPAVFAEPVQAPQIIPFEIPTQNAPVENRKVSGVKEIFQDTKARVYKAWTLPALEFLRKVPKIESNVDRERLIQNSQILVQKFKDFGIEGEVTAVRPGPVITLYEFRPGPGIKVSRIAALADDLSMALSAESVRILAPLPGKSVVGIEIPSEVREKVFLKEFLQHEEFKNSNQSPNAIPVVMGKDISGQPYFSDLARMPHLLSAGQTGSGKSVFMNGLICSLLYRFTPDELRLILVDPKFIEFRAYQDIPHLLLPVVDDPHQASVALKWAVKEMERRYRILAKLGVRNLPSYNLKVAELGADVVRDLLHQDTEGGDWHLAFESGPSGEPEIGKLPYIVVIIDELADLMMVAKKDVEISIARISQKARAAGIHLVIATQRPSTDVITGLIKANLPSRVSFQLASFIDSKTILDRAGAERLLGQGDMLFIPPGGSQPIRLQGAYVDDDEILKITHYLKSQGKPFYRDEILIEEEELSDPDNEELDPLFNQAIELIRRNGQASASYLQRHFKIGYNRAARMIETMESRGIVGPADGARPREVLQK